MPKLAFYLGKKSENPGAQWGDKLICFITNSRFSHVELVEEYNDAGNSICWSSSQREGCVRRKCIDLGTGRWVIVDADFDLGAALDWFKAHEGQGYAWLTLLNFVLPVTIWSDKHFVCSEAVGRAMGLPSPYRLSPGGLYEALARDPSSPSAQINQP